MEQEKIIVRELVTEQETAFFWEELRAYQRRDIFPELDEEDREYFGSRRYYEEIKRLHEREHNRCRYLFFQRQRQGQDIGLAMPVIYEQEDGKCFLLEFCVFPEFRGNGTGKECAEAFLAWAKSQGAAYVELNCSGERRFCFWRRVGFLPNGRDEWGEPLMLLPSERDVFVTVEMFEEAEDWQLMRLENGYLAEIGEEMLTDEKKESLKKAVSEKRILFFLAKRGSRAVGMCSVSLFFSTFECREVGSFEDFYVEPVFRKKGIGRKLAQAAQDWCRIHGVGSLTVCCAPCDEEMYQALGFTVRLGTARAFLQSGVEA